MPSEFVPNDVAVSVEQVVCSGHVVTIPLPATSGVGVDWVGIVNRDLVAVRQSVVIRAWVAGYSAVRSDALTVDMALVTVVFVQWLALMDVDCVAVGQAVPV